MKKWLTLIMLILVLILTLVGVGATSPSLAPSYPTSYQDFGYNPPAYGGAGEVINLMMGGIPLPSGGHSQQALQVEVKAGATKEFRVFCPWLISEWEATAELTIYLTGDAQVSIAGGYNQAPSISRLRGEWHKLFQNADNDIYFKVSAVNGGSLYLGTVEWLKWDNYARYYSTYPMDSITQTASYPLRLPLAEHLTKVTAYLKPLVGNPAEPETTMTLELQWRSPTQWETQATAQADVANPSVSMIILTPVVPLPHNLFNEFRLNVRGKGTLEHINVEIANK